MTDDINPERRQELTTALSVVSSQIDGLRRLVNDPMSEGLRTFIQGEIDSRSERWSLIKTELDQMDAVNVSHEALVADGYPALPDIEIPQEFITELENIVSNIQSGAGVFDPALAATGEISFGQFTDKPKE